MKLQVDSNFKQPKMNGQVVFNFKRVWNEATSYFQLGVGVVEELLYPLAGGREFDSPRVRV